MFFHKLLFVFVAVGCLQSITAGKLQYFAPPEERKCLPGRTYLIDCIGYGVSMKCTRTQCVPNEIVEEDNYIDTDVRKKRQADDYGMDEDQDFLYDDPAPLSAEQREELDRQRYVQLRQNVADRRREQRELAQHKAELARQQDEMKQELDYQREQDYQQWQEDQNQLAMDAQQQEFDDQQDYYDQHQQQLAHQLYFKSGRMSRKI